MVQFDPYGVFLLLGSVVAAAMVAPAWQRRNIPGRRAFALFMTALAVWIFGYALELLLTPVGPKFFWARVQYFGIATVIPFWLLFLVAFSGRGRWINRPNLVALFCVPVLTIAFVWLKTDWVWQRVAYSVADGRARLHYTYGVWFPVQAAFAYLLFLLAAVLLIEAVVKSPRLDRPRGAVLLLGMLAPWLANVLYLARPAWLNGLDVTPLALATVGLAMAWSVFGYGLFDHTTVAYEAVVAGLPDGVVTVDRLHHVMSLNPSAEKLFGRRLVEVRDRTLNILLPAEWWSLVLATPARQERHAEVSYRRGRTVRHYDLHLAPIPDRRQRLTGRLLTVRDVTRRKRYAEDLARQREQLAQRVAERTRELTVANSELAQAVRLKDAFLAAVSHELRTPLNGVIGTAEALQDGVYGRLAPRQQEAAGRIQQSSNHLLALISDLLDVSRLTVGALELRRETVDIAELCRSVLHMVQPQALQKELQVVSALNTTRPTITADPQRLRQILLNLLGNAIKFTPKGGQVGLSVVEDAARRLTQFVVWDTGIGIDPADQGLLFRPFTQLEAGLTRRYEGAGLGLALSQRLAQLHGGSIRVQSEVGKGSRFILTLPW